MSVAGSRVLNIVLMLKQVFVAKEANDSRNKPLTMIYANEQIRNDNEGIGLNIAIRFSSHSLA